MSREIKGFFHDLDIYSFNVGAIACSPSKVDSEILFEDFHLEWSNARKLCHGDYRPDCFSSTES
ncbi:hypothetical protein V1523DRAFT_163881 [Lipomyces doorenjongii]